MCLAGQAQKLVTVETPHRSDPISISRVTVNGTDVSCGLLTASDGYPPIVAQPVKPFVAGPDWIQNTAIYVLNRTNKNLAWFQFALVFPETGDGSMQKPLNEFNLTQGRIPAVAAFNGAGKPLTQANLAKALVFPAGQTLAVNLGDYADAIKATIINVSSASVTKMTIRLKSVFFDDGMKWDGSYAIPDPQNAGKFLRQAPMYFPGTPTWPPGSHE
jgi:hypothetical protein